MKELRTKRDFEIRFTDLEKAKAYYEPNLKEFPDDPMFVKYDQEIKNSQTLEELAKVLTKYSDIFGDGSEYFVKEF